MISCAFRISFIFSYSKIFVRSLYTSEFIFLVHTFIRTLEALIIFNVFHFSIFIFQIKLFCQFFSLPKKSAFVFLFNRFFKTSIHFSLRFLDFPITDSNSIEHETISVFWSLLTLVLTFVMCDNLNVTINFIFCTSHIQYRRNVRSYPIVRNTCHFFLFF